MGFAFSQIYQVKNGTPQGSVSSPILFNLMINYIFTQTDMVLEGPCMQMMARCGKGGAMWVMWMSLCRLLLK